MPTRRTHLPLPLLSIVCLLLAGNLCACTALFCEESASMPLPPSRHIANKEEALWKRFVTLSNASQFRGGPFRVSANLRYSDPAGENTRVSALLWGNGEAATPYPLRLDLLAGMGSVVAKVREDEASFVAYNEKEKTAYKQEQTGYRSLSSFGVPVPLSLGDLTLLLTGRGGFLFRPVIPGTDSGIPAEHSATADGARYTIPDARLPGILELSSAGVPVSWRELGQAGWEIDFEPAEINPMQPRRIRIKHPRGYSALIVIKNIEHLDKRYEPERMALSLPPGTAVRVVEPALAANAAQAAPENLPQAQGAQ